MIEITYYRNQTGKVAVSVDQGDHVIVPSGAIIPKAEVWEEGNADLRTELTPMQEATLTRQLAKIDTSPLGEIIRNFSHRRRMQERQDGINQDYRPRVVLSEGAAVVKSALKRREEER